MARVQNVVNVTLTNQHAWIIDGSDESLEGLRDFWSFTFPKAYFAPDHKLWLRALARAKAQANGKPVDMKRLPGWDGKIRLFKRGKLSAGLFRATRWDAEAELGLKFRVSYDRKDVDGFLPGIEDSQDQKYSYQNQCVERMQSAFYRGGGIVLAATGTGKTRSAAMFFSKLACHCLFVVDTLDLMGDAQKDLEKWLGEPVGTIGDSEYKPQRVTVGMRQSLAIHLEDAKFRKWLKKVQCVIVDELHEQMNKSNFDVLYKIKPIARYGLTATLEMKKKPVRYNAYAFAGPVLFEFPIKEAVKKKVVTGARVLQLLFEPVPMGEGYQEEYKDQVIKNEVKADACAKIVAKLIDHDRYVVALVDRPRHVRRLHKEMLWIRHGIAYGAVEKEDRIDARELFEAGDYRLIIANRVFKKGINIKRVDAMIDLAEMPSKNDCVQKLGRGVRLYKGKTELLYIDVGTQKNELGQDNRFAKAARARARAFTAQEIPVKKVMVLSVNDALRAVEKELKLMEKEKCQKTRPEQRNLF